MFRNLTTALFVFFVSTSFSQEICNNGIDDDGDLLIDLNDSDCACNSAGSGNPTSIIPNPSFEDMLCCPSGFSNLSCADQWVQASDATSDFLNTCNFVGPFNSSSLIPFPDGDGAVGAIWLEDYSEYVGACLSSPMVAGTQYTLQMQAAFTGMLVDVDVCLPVTPVTSIDMVVYGNTNCGNIPFFGSNCPVGNVAGCVVLGTASINLTNSNYQTLTITFTPSSDINEVIIGAPCAYPAGWLNFANYDFFNDCVPYFIFDNLILNTSASFNSLTVNDQGTLCSNDLVLTTIVAETGGNYQWFQNGIALVGQTNSTLNVSNLGLSQATYQVTYNMNGDCYEDEIVVNSTTSTPLTVNDAEICQGESAELNVTGGVNYSWSPGNGLSATTGSTVTASPNQTTTYTVSSTDENGCVSEGTSEVTVISAPNDVIVDISPIPVETEATLIATPFSYSYTWTNPDGEVFNSNPITYQFPEGEGNFQFTVEAENEFGCTYSETIQISISSDLIVYVPNSFSPDFDEHNNVFNPVISENVDAQAYSLLIFNRWGELIFESKDPAIGWDGTYDGRMVQSGVYSWSLKLKLTNKDDRRTFIGNVNVLR